MRAQAHTLEAFAAALLLIASVLFAMQVTAVTPLSASTASQHIENQQQAVADGLLSQAEAEEEIRPTLLYWDPEDGAFHGTKERGFYTGDGPPTWLGERLKGEFRDRGIVYNLRVTYLDPDGSRETKRIVYAGEPSDHAVSATRIVTLYDDDVLYEEGEGKGEPTGMTLADVTENETATFYAPNLDAEDPVYNVVEIEVIAWRM